MDEIDFAVSCSATVTDEFEFVFDENGWQRTNWMTMFQNWFDQRQNKTSIRTFQSVRDEIENTKNKLNEEVTKMGGETYISLFRA